MTAHNSSRPNTPTEQNKEDNSLILYRLDSVENKVDTMNTKLDNLNSPTRADFSEFKTGFMTALSTYQIDTNDKLKNKADLEEFIIVKRIVFGAVTVILIAVLGGFLALIGLRVH